MKLALPLARIVFALIATDTLLPSASAQSVPPTFESASVKPAPADAPQSGTGWMIGLGHQLPPHGLLTMTSALPPLITFAYNVQDEVEARAMRARLPEWARNQKFTIVARSPQDAPTIEQIRLMMRSLLEDRFALKAHRETHTGTVNSLIVARPGATGPGLKPHDPSRPCVQRASNGPPPTSEPGGPAPVFCGLELHQAAGVFHVSMVDVALPEACTLFGGLAGVLGGRSMDQVVDGTGLTGKWDITMEFVPQRDETAPNASPDDTPGGPNFSNALEKQLGLRLKKTNGQVEDLMVNHIAQPTPD
jgi:uncharacterized protein (TIGR03435 family)